jgi:hypothetical protein
MDPAAVDSIIDYARLAPSVHNTQPWTWHVRDEHVDLYAELSRRLVHTDPDGRDLMISCGAALHHLQVAARALGWSARVQRVPNPYDKALVARVTLSAKPAVPDGPEILDAIKRRRTDRRRFSSWPLPAERLNSLALVGNQWGANVLPVYEDDAKARLERLTKRADELQKRDPRYTEELDRWTTYWGTQGVPVGHIPKEATVGSADVLNRRFGGGLLDDPEIDADAPADGMLLICTSSDDTVSRIRAGEALSAVWLQATREHMSLVPLSQALEVAETRAALQRDVLDDLAFAQLILRLGWLPLDREPLAAAARRDLDEVRVRR